MYLGVKMVCLNISGQKNGYIQIKSDEGRTTPLITLEK